MTKEHYHFVTGRLAEAVLRATVSQVAEEMGFDWSVGVMPITVAALMTPRWISRHIAPPGDATRVVLPGYCDGDLDPLTERLNVPVEIGPRDLRQLPDYFGRDIRIDDDYGDYDIEIIAEINHAPRCTLDEVREHAARLATAGADIIDIGCEPGDPWPGVAECVSALRDDGYRVSIDSLNPAEIGPAVRAGAELVLSVNRSNRDAAPDWGCEVVVIPDDLAELDGPAELAGLEETAARLDAAGVRYRLDPILEPIGLGFARSLERYSTVRRRFPAAAMMMGIGNLSELTDVDSAGINVLLLGFCQELAIGSVLTTQVINWARTSVRECDLARRLVHYAVRRSVPPKHLEPGLVTLRDAKLQPFGDELFEQLARQIRDHNFRIFAEDGLIHLLAAGLHLDGDDPFLLLEQLLASGAKNVDPSHAFYLGYEMAKARIALTLGKEYRQDEALDWGYLTRPEESHRSRQ